MSIYLNKDSRIIVQGMTGGMGSKHTTLMVEAGSNIVGGVNARKAGTSVELGGKDLPVFGSVEEAMKETGADVSVVFVPPGLHQGRLHRGHRRGHRPARGDHRGRAGAGQRRGVRLPRGAKQPRGHPDDRSELPRHHHPGGVAGRHHAAHHRRQGPGRPGLEVGHADLPDDVRAEGLRLHHRDRHRRRPGHRHHAHRRPRGVRERPGHQGDRDDRRDRRRRRGAGGGLHQGPRDQAGRRLRRRLHRPRGQDDGPRRRDRLRLLGHRPGQEGGPRGRRASRSARRRRRPPS